MLDVRNDFPFLERIVNGKPIRYLDNAATTQKPRQVINCLTELYASGVSNVHRAVNFLANEVTEAFEGGRETVARFIGAQAREIAFVSNATQAINVVSRAVKVNHVLTTTLEHHSNLLPWMDGRNVDFIPWRKDGAVDLDTLVQKLRAKPDLVAVTAASNLLGTLFPVKEIAGLCREAGVPVLVDASQAIAHVPQLVREIGCDFLVFSGHKIYGPSGTGVLYIRNEIIEDVSPAFLGGSMVKEVHADSYVVNDIPYRFEAGTPNIEGVIALASALDYFSKLGYEAVATHEAQLALYAKKRLSEIRGLTLYGPAPGEPCAPLATFQLRGLESNGIAKILGNRANVIVRSGFHCAQPAHDQLGIGPTVRASFGVYNTKDEIDCMVDVLKSLAGFLG